MAAKTEEGRVANLGTKGDDLFISFMVEWCWVDRALTQLKES